MQLGRKVEGVWQLNFFGCADICDYGLVTGGEIQYVGFFYFFKCILCCTVSSFVKKKKIVVFPPPVLSSGWLSKIG